MWQHDPLLLIYESFIHYIYGQIDTYVEISTYASYERRKQNKRHTVLAEQIQT